MKKIIYIIVISLFIVSCGEQEIEQYDANNGRTLIKFESNTSNLEVLLNDQGTVEIPISVSTFSNSDRTIMVDAIPFPDGTSNAALSNQYSFESEVTIPANELFGTLKVTGIDEGLEVSQIVKLQLKITQANFDNFSISSDIHTVNISKICPVDENYLVGTYRLNSPLAGVFCNAPQPSFIGNGIEVEVSVGDTPSQRVFSSRFAPGSCDAFSAISNYRITLLCGQAFLSSSLNTGVFCGGAEVVIANDSDNSTSYDDNDDSTITINVIETTGGTCSVMSRNQSFTLTKL